MVWTGAALAQPDSHPLVGRVWDTREERFLDRDELLEQLLSARRVLLGEVHDNEVQHSWQAVLLRHLVARNSRGVLVLEMFDHSDQPRLNATTGMAWEVADPMLGAIARANGWEWPLYAPLVRVAHEAGWRLLGGNLSRGEAMAVVRGTEAVAPAVRDALPNAAREVLAGRIGAGHCGLLSRTQIEPMVDAQQARDAALARVVERAVETAGGSAPVVLLAGNEHVRRDIGVPRYLSSMNLLSVGFLEATRGRDQPLDYYAMSATTAEPLTATRGGQGELPGPWDLIWFAPAQERSDPCEVFQRHRAG